MDLSFSDCETFLHDWLFVFKRQSDGAIEAFWNDPASVQDFLATEKPVVCGFNYRDFDSYILKAVMLDWSPEDVNEVSQTIIHNDDRTVTWALFNGEPFVELPPVIDLFHDIVPRKGLKEIEANLGMDIEECDIDFDIQRPLTPSERDEVLRYCIHDVEATEVLYGVRYDYVKAKADLCMMQGLDPLTMLKHTNARVVAEALCATPTSHPYEVYEIPENVDLSAIPQDVIAYVLQWNTDNCTDKDAPSLEFMFHGCPTVVGLGGIHAAIPKYKETASEDRVILLQDIGSYYPSLIINNGYMSRATADSKLYKGFYDKRMKAKAAGDKATADAAKLVLNTTYGAMKDPHNKLFDPMQATRVCLSGQLYIIDLIEQLHRELGDSLTIIQLNTDGWLISCRRDDLTFVDGVVSAWKERTGFTVETTEVERVVQANVNNYVMRTVDGKIKAKGGIVAHHAGGDFKSNSATIIDKAVVDYLLDGKPIADTVNECTDLERFQIIAKAGSTFQKVVHQVYDDALFGYVEVPVQRVNRIYALRESELGTDGGIFKVKMENGVEISRQRIPLTPEHCFVDNRNLWKTGENWLTQLDREWYIDLAQKKAKDFVTRDKKEKQLMATEDESTNALTQEEAPKPTRKGSKKSAPAEETVPVVPFYRKLLALQAAMGGIASVVKFDKAVSVGGGSSSDYADTQQYKMKLAQICCEVGLVVKLDIESTYPEESPNDKSRFGSQTRGTITLIDADTGERETYEISGFGVNNQIGFATGVSQTNALRGWLLNNFMLDNRGRDGDDQAANGATSSAGNGYTPPAAKAEIKQGIKATKTEEAKYTNTTYAEALYEKVKEAQAIKPGFGQAMLDKYFEEDGSPKLSEDGKCLMLRKDAVSGMNAAEEIVNNAEAAE